MFQCTLDYSLACKSDKSPVLIFFAKSDMDAKIPKRMLHDHRDRVEIFYVSEGKGIHRINGVEYKINKGDIIIINPNTLHEEIFDEKTGMSIFCCGICAPDLNANQIIGKSYSPILHSGHFEKQFDNILYCMYDQISKNREAASDVYQPLLQALIAMVKRLAKEKKFDDEILEHEYTHEYTTNRVKKFFDNHYNEMLSLDEVAASMNMSVSYLSHTFKKETGYSPNRYLITRRIGESQTLLSMTDYPITVVSSMVGYDNSNYFSTLFKKIVGLPPKDYRYYWDDI